eukprot:CAMPEP_0203953730 /NCGR_PEP_ID=MMETSP0359-20131031/87026_1 /ASSEMBLY_ACC=CAM_ASM_000338 /TAXON_ID=268821 /ORGANISM="Scrippsiella Hangoei, Strain SHTV-5" /LENGTH=39 /DNA_ID= /DNA_START= /DNA_END= /DNA_ORIENTATION=
MRKCSIGTRPAADRTLRRSVAQGAQAMPQSAMTTGKDVL